MCAADPLGEGSGHKSACKSFTYNKTAKDCVFFGLAQQEHADRIKDACCTSGPPCNLDIMREQIQKLFDAKMRRALASKEKKVNERSVNNNATSSVLLDGSRDGLSKRAEGHGQAAGAKHAVPHLMIWHLLVVIGLLGMVLVMVSRFFRSRLVLNKHLNNQGTQPQHHNDRFTVAGKATGR
jgi:hypothetical protein